MKQASDTGGKFTGAFFLGDEARSPGKQSTPDRIAITVRRKHQHPQTGRRGEQLWDELEPGLFPKPEIHNRDLGPRGSDTFQSFVIISSLATDCHVRLRINQKSNPAANDWIVVDNENWGFGCSWNNVDVLHGCG